VRNTKICLKNKEEKPLKVIVDEDLRTRYETGVATYAGSGEMGGRIAAAKNADDEEPFMEGDEECSIEDVIQAWRRLRRT
jgi:hypothetical protein